MEIPTREESLERHWSRMPMYVLMDALKKKQVIAENNQTAVKSQV